MVDLSTFEQYYSLADMLIEKRISPLRAKLR
jgi:hypothetical protein